MNDYELRVLSVRCTLCNAGSGFNCRDEQGREKAVPHVARMDAYELALARDETGGDRA